MQEMMVGVDPFLEPTRVFPTSRYNWGLGRSRRGGGQGPDTLSAAGTPLIWKIRNYQDHVPEEPVASVLMKAEV